MPSPRRALAWVPLFAFSLCCIWAEPRAHADEDEAFSSRKQPENPRDLCAVADSNLARARQAVLAAAERIGAAPSQRALSVRWDHRTPPRFLDRIERRFTLRPSERQLLFDQGFVVPARLSASSYAFAYHEIHQSQLPVYVSIDSVLHAVYAANDTLVADFERKLLLPRLVRLLSSLRTALPQAAAHYPEATAQDLDLYLTVAARLLDAKAPPALSRGAQSAADSLLAPLSAHKELATVELFGRPRLLDFSQYAPRGHYGDESGLSAYFAAVMWLSRLEFNLVSRSSRSSATGMTPDPRETPREAVLALALADLVTRAGVQPELRLLEQAFSLLAGRREDVSVAELQALRQEARIVDLKMPDAAERLRRAIGERFQRTAQLHPMPQGSTVLPAIATLLGPRVVPDVAVLSPLVHDSVPGRYRVGIVDVLYALGHDRALAHLEAELQRFPTLRGQLDKARALLARPAESDAQDLYSAWLKAVAALSNEEPGIRPSFMSTPAFSDLRLNSAAAGFSQLRHNSVLLAGQAYDQGGCDIPDGYVEPAIGVYTALLEYARRGQEASKRLDEKDETGARAYFARLHEILAVLRAIAQSELAGAPLSEEARRFLAMVSEMAPGSSGGPPTYTGWYFDLFRQRQDEGLSGGDLIADYYTSTNLQEAAYAGVSGVRLGLFVVDGAGGARAFVGPVARAYEHHHSLAAEGGRLSDEAARSLPESARRDPWAKSYTVAAPTVKPFTVSYSPDTSPDITVEAPEGVGLVRFTLLDHHRVPLASLSRTIGKGRVVFRFPPKSPTGKSFVGSAVDGLGVQVGEFFQSAEVNRGGEGGLHMNLGATPP